MKIFLRIFILIVFFVNSLGPMPVYADVGAGLASAPKGQSQGLPLQLPKPGVMIHLSPPYMPAHLSGLVIHPEDPLKFDFLINRGDDFVGDGLAPSQEGRMQDSPLRDKQKEYTKLIKYFLASLTVPDENQWVNLSPYEKDRIIKDDFGKTEMGRDLLAQDYLLKQITASLIYPQDKLGQTFWDRVYERAYKEYGTTQVPVNTFNKVWIVPDEAAVYESGNTVYVLRNHLKVMLEEDYLSMQKNSPPLVGGVRGGENQRINPLLNPPHKGEETHSLGSQIVRDIILPELEKEINENQNFALLRQIYSGMILATWYKHALKESLLTKIYADKSKIKGIALPTKGHVQDKTNENVSPSTLPSEDGLNMKATQRNEPSDIEIIYQRYLQAFKKGVFNYIKEDVDKYTKEQIPRKYFSGGMVAFDGAMRGVTEGFKDKALMVVRQGQLGSYGKNFNLPDAAHVSDLDMAQVVLNTKSDDAMAPDDQQTQAYSDEELAQLRHMPKDDSAMLTFLTNKLSKIKGLAPLMLGASIACSSGGCASRNRDFINFNDSQQRLVHQVDLETNLQGNQMRVIESVDALVKNDHFYPDGLYRIGPMHLDRPIVVVVHGFTDSPSRAQNYLRALVDQYNVFVYKYDSWGENLPVLSQQFRQAFKEKLGPYLKTNKVAFLTFSYGAHVVVTAILDEQDEPNRKGTNPFQGTYVMPLSSVLAGARSAEQIKRWEDFPEPILQLLILPLMQERLKKFREFDPKGVVIGRFYRDLPKIHDLLAGYQEIRMLGDETTPKNGDVYNKLILEKAIVLAKTSKDAHAAVLDGNDGNMIKITISTLDEMLNGKKQTGPDPAMQATVESLQRAGSDSIDNYHEFDIPVELTDHPNFPQRVERLRVDQVGVLSKYQFDKPIYSYQIRSKVYQDKNSGQWFFPYSDAKRQDGGIQKGIYAIAKQVGFNNFVEIRKVGEDFFTRIAQTYTDEEIKQAHTTIEDLFLAVLFFGDWDHSPVHKHNVYVRTIDGKDRYLLFDFTVSKMPQGLDKPLTRSTRLHIAEYLSTFKFDRTIIDKRVNQLEISKEQRELLRGEIEAVFAEMRGITETAKSPKDTFISSPRLTGNDDEAMTTKAQEGRLTAQQAREAMSDLARQLATAQKRLKTMQGELQKLRSSDFQKQGTKNRNIGDVQREIRKAQRAVEDTTRRLSDLITSSRLIEVQESRGRNVIPPGAVILTQYVPPAAAVKEAPRPTGITILEEPPPSVNPKIILKENPGVRFVPDFSYKKFGLGVLAAVSLLAGTVLFINWANNQLNSLSASNPQNQPIPTAPVPETLKEVTPQAVTPPSSISPFLATAQGHPTIKAPAKDIYEYVPPTPGAAPSRIPLSVSNNNTWATQGVSAGSMVPRGNGSLMRDLESKAKADSNPILFEIIEGQVPAGQFFASGLMNALNTREGGGPIFTQEGGIKIGGQIDKSSPEVVIRSKVPALKKGEEVTMFLPGYVLSGIQTDGLPLILDKDGVHAVAEKDTEGGFVQWKLAKTSDGNQIATINPQTEQITKELEVFKNHPGLRDLNDQLNAIPYADAHKTQEVIGEFIKKHVVYNEFMNTEVKDTLMGFVGRILNRDNGVIRMKCDLGTALAYILFQSRGIEVVAASGYSYDGQGKFRRGIGHAVILYNEHGNWHVFDSTKFMNPDNRSAQVFAPNWQSQIEKQRGEINKMKDENNLEGLVPVILSNKYDYEIRKEALQILIDRKANQQLFELANNLLTDEWMARRAIQSIETTPDNMNLLLNILQNKSLSIAIRHETLDNIYIERSSAVEKDPQSQQFRDKLKIALQEEINTAIPDRESNGVFNFKILSMHLYKSFYGEIDAQMTQRFAEDFKLLVNKTLQGEFHFEYLVFPSAVEILLQENPKILLDEGTYKNVIELVKKDFKEGNIGQYYYLIGYELGWSPRSEFNIKFQRDLMPSMEQVVKDVKPIYDIHNQESYVSWHCLVDLIELSQSADEPTRQEANLALNRIIKYFEDLKQKQEAKVEINEFKIPIEQGDQILNDKLKDFKIEPIFKINAEAVLREIARLLGQGETGKLTPPDNEKPAEKPVDQKPEQDKDQAMSANPDAAMMSRNSFLAALATTAMSCMNGCALQQVPTPNYTESANRTPVKINIYGYEHQNPFLMYEIDQLPQYISKIMNNGSFDDAKKGDLIMNLLEKITKGSEHAFIVSAYKKDIATLETSLSSGNIRYIGVEASSSTLKESRKSIQKLENVLQNDEIKKYIHAYLEGIWRDDISMIQNRMKDIEQNIQDLIMVSQAVHIYMDSEGIFKKYNPNAELIPLEDGSDFENNRKDAENLGRALLELNAGIGLSDEFMKYLSKLALQVIINPDKIDWNEIDRYIDSHFSDTPVSIETKDFLGFTHSTTFPPKVKAKEIIELTKKFGEGAVRRNYSIAQKISKIYERISSGKMPFADFVMIYGAGHGPGVESLIEQHGIPPANISRENLEMDPWYKKVLEDIDKDHAMITRFLRILGEEIKAGLPFNPVGSMTENQDAAKAAKGGIDFNSANLNLQIKRDGNGVPLPLAQQDMRLLEQIEGFVPVILEIKPAIGLPILSELQQLQTATS